MLVGTSEMKSSKQVSRQVETADFNSFSYWP